MLADLLAVSPIIVLGLLFAWMLTWPDDNGRPL